MSSFYSSGDMVNPFVVCHPIDRWEDRCKEINEQGKEKIEILKRVRSTQRERIKKRDEMKEDGDQKRVIEEMKEEVYLYR